MTRLTSPPAHVARELLDQYQELLRGWLASPDEASLHEAYQFGREMFSQGFGLLEMVDLHGQAVARLLAAAPSGLVAVIDAADKLLLEGLGPFEMTHRGFREANVALRASEERYRELFENANDIIFTTDLAGRLTSVNRAGLALTGFSREEVLERNVGAIVAPEYLAIIRALRHPKPGESDDRSRRELEIIAQDGRRIPLEVSTRLVYNEGVPAAIQGIARDVTDRKQAELALRHLNQGLEEKAQRIAHALHDEAGQLLASVYLNVAEIAAELPRKSRLRVEGLRTLLDQVDDQIRRLAHELRPTILDDLGLVPACEFLAKGVAGRFQVQIEVRGSTGGRLPPDVETALYRVTQEALTNASKHARATTVAVEFERVDHVVRGEIRDDGVGFDVPEVLTRIGTRGLGLIGMRERLVAIGGTLTIRSAENLGTSIAFDVPLER